MVLKKFKYLRFFSLKAQKSNFKKKEKINILLKYDFKSYNIKKYPKFNKFKKFFFLNSLYILKFSKFLIKKGLNTKIEIFLYKTFFILKFLLNLNLYYLIFYLSSKLVFPINLVKKKFGRKVDFIPTTYTPVKRYLSFFRFFFNNLFKSLRLPFYFSFFKTLKMVFNKRHLLIENLSNSHKTIYLNRFFSHYRWYKDTNFLLKGRLKTR